jgi:acyl carrier protein
MEETVKEIIERHLGINPSSYTNESKFVEDLACDSLDMIEVIMECEREFNIAIPDDVISKLITVQDLIDYIKEHTK